MLDKASDDLDVIISGYFDYAFTAIFALEMIIKQISMGFVVSKGSYLRDSWCQVDMFIVILSIMDLSLTNFDLPVIKVLRLLRTLRPLRIISHNVSMKIMINALIESLISVFNVAIVMIVVWLIFAILGVSLFGGKLYHCENPNISTQIECENYGYT